MKSFIYYNILLVFVFNMMHLNLKASALNNQNSILFKIVRSKDANEIFYKVKTTPDGSLDLEEPIKIYWIKNTKNGRAEPLTKIQQHFAYGLKFLEIAPEKAEFQFFSYPKRTLKLRKNDCGNFGVFTIMDGVELELESVFIQIDGGTFWFPKITHVEVHAKNTVANQLVVEIIKP